MAYLLLKDLKLLINNDTDTKEINQTWRVTRKQV